MFVVYEPRHFRDYFRKIVTVPAGLSPIERFDRELGVLAWSTILMYRARLVPWHFSRRLRAMFDQNGALLGRFPPDPLNSQEYRVDLTMQLGIEVVANYERVKQRIDEQPYDAQMIYDTLYYPGVLHERFGVTEEVHDITPDTLRDHLRQRTGGNEQEDGTASYPPSVMMDFLFQILTDYISLLRNPDEIREATIDKAERDGATAETAEEREAKERERRLWYALADGILAVDPPLIEIQ